MGEALNLFMSYRQIFRDNPKTSNQSWSEYFATIQQLFSGEPKMRTVQRAYAKWAKKENKKECNQGNQIETPGDADTITFHDDGSKDVEATFKGRNIRTQAEALEASGIDANEWNVTKCVIKHWTTPMKVKRVIREDGKRVTEGVAFDRSKIISFQEEQVIQNSGVSLSLTPKTPHQEEFMKMVLDNINPLEAQVSRYDKRHVKSLLVEQCIFDLHLGKTAFDPIKGEVIWSLDEAGSVYNDCVENSLMNTDLNSVKKFVIPFGNDLLHIDSTTGTTTGGTPVGDGGLWFTLYTYALQLLKKHAMELSRIAPVELIPIPGNHDYHSVLSLSAALQEYFRDSPDVNVRCNGLNREHEHFGANLIGWHHGDKVSHQKIKDSLYADVPELIGSTKFKYVHMGHLHSSIRKDFIVRDTIKEEFGVEVEHISSLCPTDYWHHKMLYVGNMRRAKTFIYDYDHGMTQQIIYNL